MVSVSKTDVYSWMSSVAVPSKAGDPVVLGEVSEVVDTPKLCQSGPQESGEASLPQLDLVALVAVSVAVSKAEPVVVDLEAVSEAVIDPTFVVDEEVSDTKAEAALAEEVGMAPARQMAMEMAQHHPLMLHLDLEEEAALVVGMVPLPPSMVV